jgi:hypothetical protein
VDHGLPVSECADSSFPGKNHVGPIESGFSSGVSLVVRYSQFDCFETTCCFVLAWDSMENNRQLLAATAFLSRETDKHVDPYWANYDARQSLTKSLRDRLSDNIQRPVHIGMNQPIA